MPVLEKAEQLAEVPKIVSQDRIQQRSVEHTFDILDPQDGEELAESLKVFSQDTVEQRYGGQIIEPLQFYSLRRSLRSFRRKKRRNRL